MMIRELNGPTVQERADLLEDAASLTKTLKDLTRLLQFRDRDRLCREDITVSQCYALNAVVEGGGIGVNELASQLYLDKSTASRLAAGLEEKGYVERVVDPKDRRSLRIEPTREGLRLCRAIDDSLVAETQEMLMDFDPEVRLALTKILSRLTDYYAERCSTDGGCCTTQGRAP